MSGAFNSLKRGFSYAEPVVHALQLIQNVTGIGGADATTALKIIDAIVNTLDDGFENGLDSADIIKELDKLTVGIAANDVRVDEALADKFRGR